jgi:hypothetical protein
MSVDAAAADRLPWLADEVLRPALKERPRKSLLPLAAATVALVGLAGFWMGARSVHQPALQTIQHERPTMTVELPPSRPVASPEVRLPAQRDVRPEPVAVVRPVPEREVRIAVPPHAKAAARSEVTTVPIRQATPVQSQQNQRVESSSQPARFSVPNSSAPFIAPIPWNPRVFAGAAGRLVQVGAFGTVVQAKRGWWFMVSEYPAMAHLPAVVRPTRNSRGRVFYRFQVGTTSQAHSEVLCQRMEKIHLSCAVVGLPWKAKVER